MTVRLAAAAMAALLAGCAQGVNYEGPAGPRFAGAPEAALAEFARPAAAVRVVTWNTAYANDVEGLIGLLASDEGLRGADLLALQEMDESATRRVAEALGFYWVFYPATLHPVVGRNFGNALLSRWRIEADEKHLLPHVSRWRGTRRAAVAGTVRIGGRPVRVVALHLATPFEVGPCARREQARAALAAARGWTHAIVAGDFNRAALGGLLDEEGLDWATRGLGPTWWRFGLDHVATRGFVTVARGSVATPAVSDHRAVWAELTFR